MSVHITQVRYSDILFGQSITSTHHIGNLCLKVMLDARLEAFSGVAVSQAEKFSMVAQCVASIQDAGGRFLKQAGGIDESVWTEVDKETAIHEVSLALQDRLKRRTNIQTTQSKDLLTTVTTSFTETMSFTEIRARISRTQIDYLPSQAEKDLNEDVEEGLQSKDLRANHATAPASQSLRCSDSSQNEEGAATSSQLASCLRFPNHFIQDSLAFSDDAPTFVYSCDSTHNTCSFAHPPEGNNHHSALPIVPFDSDEISQKEQDLLREDIDAILAIIHGAQIFKGEFEDLENDFDGDLFRNCQGQ